MSLIPKHYLTETTPDGPRFYYPDQGIRTDAAAIESPGGRIQHDHARRMLVTDHLLTTLTWRGPDVTRTTGYVLKALDAESTRYPRQVTVEWREARAWCRCDNDCEDDCAADIAVRDLYAPVTETVPDQTRTLDYSDHREYPAGHGLGPDQRPDVLWRAGALVRVHGEEFAHLLPGHIPDVQFRVIAALEALPRVERLRPKYSGSTTFEVTVVLDLDQERVTWHDRYGARGQLLRSRERRVATTRRETLLLHGVPHAIEADTKAEAVAELEKVLSLYTGLLDDLDMRVCSTCDGQGVLPPEPGLNTPPTPAR